MRGSEEEKKRGRGVEKFRESEEGVKGVRAHAQG